MGSMRSAVTGAIVMFTSPRSTHTRGLGPAALTDLHNEQPASRGPQRASSPRARRGRPMVRKTSKCPQVATYDPLGGHLTFDTSACPPRLPARSSRVAALSRRGHSRTKGCVHESARTRAREYRADRNQAVHGRRQGGQAGDRRLPPSRRWLPMRATRRPSSCCGTIACPPRWSWASFARGWPRRGACPPRPSISCERRPSASCPPWTRCAWAWPRWASTIAT